MNSFFTDLFAPEKPKTSSRMVIAVYQIELKIHLKADHVNR